MIEEPTPDERRYYRHRQTGQRGWLVLRDGAKSIRLDRAAQVIVIPFTDEWVADNETALFTLHQVTAIAFAADRRLLAALGQHQPAKKEWLDLPERKRIAWVKDGPASEGAGVHELRPILWRAIMGALGEHAK